MMLTNTGRPYARGGPAHPFSNDLQVLLEVCVTKAGRSGACAPSLPFYSLAEKLYRIV